MHEIMKTTQDMKEELYKYVENLRKKNQTETIEIKVCLNQIKNTGKICFNRLKQVEDRISGLGDKIYIKKKTQRILRQKTQKL
jgi:hypothetical protein